MLRRSSLMISILLLLSCEPQDKDWVKPDTISLGCEDYQSIPVGQAILYNNVWNKNAAGDFDWRQCLEQKPGTDSSIYGWSWHWPNESDKIFGYPQIKKGSSPWDPLPKIDDRFPAAIRQLDSLIISHELEISAQGQHNVATSMWLTSSPDIGDKPNPSIITAEIMVWTFATAKHLDPAGRNIGVIEQDGKKWSVWLDRDWSDASGQNDNKWIYLTFKAEESTLANRYDIVRLLKNELLSDLDLGNHFIADIELGTEIMRGSGLVWVKNFEVEMERTLVADESDRTLANTR